MRPEEFFINAQCMFTLLICLDVDKLAEEDEKYNLESNVFTFHTGE